MGVVLGILAAIFGLVVNFFAAQEFRRIAEDKGYRGGKYFWWSFLFGFCGWAMVIALPKVSAQAKERSAFEELESISKLKEEGVLSADEYEKLRAYYLKQI